MLNTLNKLRKVISSLGIFMFAPLSFLPESWNPLKISFAVVFLVSVIFNILEKTTKKQPDSNMGGSE